MLRFEPFMRSVVKLLGTRLKRLREEQALKAPQVAAMRFKHVVAPACRKEPTTECGSRTPDAGPTSGSRIRGGQMVAKNGGMFPRRSAANFACLAGKPNSMLQSHS